jgi:hypothetical protein
VRRRQWLYPGVVPATTSKRNDLWTAGLQGPLRTKNESGYFHTSTSPDAVDFLEVASASI